MVIKPVFIFVLAFICLSARAQFNQESNSHIPLRGFGFIQRTSIHHHLKRDCGIYSTPDDRKSGKLSLAIDCRSEDHTIKAGFLREKSAIKVVRNSETQKFLREDIFGYRDCNGNEFHFFDGRSYHLINPGETIPIYRVFEWKGKQRVTRYFFADGTSHDVLPLTLANLRQAFAGEPLFLRKISLLAENDFKLIKYLHAINQVRIDAFQQGISSTDEPL